VLRYAIFTVGRPFVLILLGLALHGLCFDFFFAAGFTYVDKMASPEIRNSGQSLFVALTYGLGMYLGTELSGRVNQWTTREMADPMGGGVRRVTNWSAFWLVPFVGAAVSLALYLLLRR
jgi:hypothetical protein